MVTCPKCDVGIEHDCILDTDFDVDFVTVQWTGHCPYCYRAYFWNEVFRFEFSENLKEV